MKRHFYRRMIALLLLVSLLLSGCTGGTGEQAQDANAPADMAKLLCPPSPGNNPCVSWNS